MKSKNVKTESLQVRPTAPLPAQFLPRLGVNIDHFATLRQLRGTSYPDLLEIVRIVEDAGADQITVHLREDRRHIQDEDVRHLRKFLKIPMNLELAATDAMIKNALKIQPAWACIVPEKRQEVTTEGGLELKKGKARLQKAILVLQKKGIKVSLFIEPTIEAVRLSAELGVEAVEFHTGRYALATQSVKNPGLNAKAKSELKRIQRAAEEALRLGVRPHAGHGLDLKNVRPLVELERPVRRGEVNLREPLLEEYNIGHYLVCRSAVVGVKIAVLEMISALQAP